MRGFHYCLIGLDLAGKSSRPSGICLWWGKEVRTFVLYTDNEIIRLVKIFQPDIVAIDAPLSYSRDYQNSGVQAVPAWRECDLALRRKNIRLFPLNFNSMRELTKRGVALKTIMEKQGFKVIEVYPGGAQDILGLPRARKNRKALYEGLRKLGLEGLSSDCSVHELDAATAALVGMFYLKGEAKVYGDPTEGTIIMPPEATNLN